MSDVTRAAENGAASSAAIQEIFDWFARYDDLVRAGDLEAMADMAAFPLNEVTDDAAGHGVTAPCDRERFIAQMREVVGADGGGEMTSTRHPIFLSPSLCFVVTDASFTVGGEETAMRYGDLLIRTADGWKFQTMVAGGWHEQM
ncbi:MULTISPECIES: nuclear transport factor 2 family protein [unclassified Microbacterium]|uniref:nuclear transport factor 2 family protein n=1 Tax=unclassified Microbacterium TaxID=2609290 RepID=UPI000EAACA22|nr:MULTISPECIES: nuclear transport factor 2 family protein [unclassified Microbacterium]MBT2484168.1 nuclear transport factor 2 family protein [Microbacterium sp. ISL-108]RKN67108.1 nuclear transport factor 2 family protein [Microbacterium sp. CGR2]